MSAFDCIPFHPKTMSTQPQTTEIAQTRTATTQFTTRDAPQTFNPHNTDPCPTMFADKWAATEE